MRKIGRDMRGTQSGSKTLAIVSPLYGNAISMLFQFAGTVVFLLATVHCEDTHGILANSNKKRFA